VPQEIESSWKSSISTRPLLDCTFQLIIQLLKDDYIAQSGTVTCPRKSTACISLRKAVPAHRRARTLVAVQPALDDGHFTLYGADGGPLPGSGRRRFNSITDLRRSIGSSPLSRLPRHPAPAPPVTPRAARLFETNWQKKFHRPRPRQRGPRPLKRYTTRRSTASSTAYATVRRTRAEVAAATASRSGKETSSPARTPIETARCSRA